jgi:hypothetical protein
MRTDADMDAMLKIGWKACPYKSPKMIWLTAQLM